MKFGCILETLEIEGIILICTQVCNTQLNPW